MSRVRAKNNSEVSPHRDTEDLRHDASQSESSGVGGGAGELASTITLVANTVGGGMLAMSWAVRQCTLVTGCVILVLVCVLNAFCFVVIAHCCEIAADAATAPISTYSDLVHRSLTPKTAFVVKITTAAYTVGSCVSYLVLASDFWLELTDQALDHFFPDPEHHVHLVSRTKIITLLAVCVLIPLTLVRNLSSLRYTSFFNLAAILYVMLLLVVRAVSTMTLGSSSLTHLRVMDLPNELFSAVPIMSVAFTAHYNAPSYFRELKGRSVHKMRRVVVWASIVCLTCYTTAAIAGYLAFGDSTCGDILNNFAMADGYAEAARLLLGLMVLFAYPLAFHSLRSTAISLLPTALGQSRFFLTVLLVFFTSLLALWADKIEVVLAYKGALCGGLLVYIFPAMMLRSLLSGNAPCQQKTFEEKHGARSDDSVLSLVYRPKCRDSGAAYDEEMKSVIEAGSLIGQSAKIGGVFKSRRHSVLSGKDEQTQWRPVVLGLMAVGLWLNLDRSGCYLFKGSGSSRLRPLCLCTLTVVHTVLAVFRRQCLTCMELSSV